MTSIRLTRHAAIRAIPAVVMLLLLSAAATASGDSERCRAHGILDACYDAIRRSPRDPALLAALGDALERSNRPVEAVRAYRRAAALAPNNHGIAAKIGAIEAKQTSRSAAGNASMPGSAAHGAGGQRPSNTEPVTKSH